MASKSKSRSAKRRKPTSTAKRAGNSRRPRRQEPLDGPRPVPVSTLSRQSLSRTPPPIHNSPDSKPTPPLSGDLTDIPETGFASAETVPELIAEGQDLEAEMLEAVEDAPDPDRGNIRINRAPNKIHSYKDRKKI